MKKTKTTKTVIIYDANDKIIEKRVEIVEVEETNIPTGGYVSQYPWYCPPKYQYFGDQVMCNESVINTSTTNTSSVISKEVKEALDNMKKDIKKGFNS